MKHLSVLTKELPPHVVGNFECTYRMGDEFVSEVPEVDCSTCVKQIERHRRQGVIDELVAMSRNYDLGKHFAGAGWPEILRTAARLLSEKDQPS